VTEPEYFPVEGAPAGLWITAGAATPEQTKARSNASRAASAREIELNQQGEGEWTMRWDKDQSRYCVYVRPFEAPKEPWSETNAPIRRRPNLEKRPSQFVPLDTLLIAARDLGIFQWAIAQDRPKEKDAPQIVTDLQAALDKQYGRGHFYAHRHGNSISVQCRYPVEKKDG
jgi:hypothetical protein